MSDEQAAMPPEQDEELRRIWDQAEHYPPVTTAEIRQMCKSPSAETRLLALLLMRGEMGDGDPIDEFFDSARDLIEDENNNCRWQALIVIGYFIDSRPEDVWRIIEQYGVSDDDDMRTGVGCVLLEHLLETHFERFFPALREIILAGSTQMTHTLTLCYMPYPREHRRMIRELLTQVGEDHPMLREDRDESG
ncbi:MAG: hypothetical protein SYC29_12885 [Planctomycetota bacterium]|nr:hypothetical protein [Planctomycetota bacterium]